MFKTSKSLILALCFGLIFPISAEELTQVNTAVQAKAEPTLQELNARVATQANITISQIEHIVIVVNKGALKKLKKSQKIAITKNLNNAKAILAESSQQDDDEISLDSIQTKCEQIATIRDYAKNVAINIKKEIAPFKAVKNKSIKADLCIEELSKHIKNLENDAKVFSKIISNTGLTRFNQWWKSVNNANRKYDLAVNSILVGSLILTTAIFISHMELYEYIEQKNTTNGTSSSTYTPNELPSIWKLGPLFRSTQKLAGETPRFDNKNRLMNRGNLGIVGTIELTLRSFCLASLAPLALPATIHAGCSPLWNKKWKQIQEWAQKQGEIKNQELQGKDTTAIDTSLQAPTLLFKDVIGLEKQKEELQSVLEWVKNPNAFRQIGAKIPRCILLEGLTRTGKTHLVEALAGEINKILKETGRGGQCAFKKIQLKELYNWYGPEGSKKSMLNSIMDDAERNSPCVVFLDEIHLLQLQKNANPQLLNDFLIELNDIVIKQKDVIFIAATNNPQLLDNALKQPGRFDLIIRFENPSFEERKAYLTEKALSNILELPESTIETLAQKTDGCTFGRIQVVIDKAIQKAKISQEGLNIKHIECALDEVVYKMINQSVFLPEEEKEIISTHMAGHATANILLQAKDKIERLTIRKFQKDIEEISLWDIKLTNDNSEKNHKDESQLEDSVEYGKMFTLRDRNSASVESYNEKIKQLKITLAGHEAEKILLGSTAHSFHENDFKEALSIATSIIFGKLDKKTLPKSICEEKQKEAYDLVIKCQDDVKKLLTENQSKLGKLAKELQYKEILNLEEIKNIIK
ncbi:MAG: ATP-dependent zinc metalloprotease FtsH [candidate division TM6 bacterium GW2011_GWF2_32_72]|nr:MAG: ATP-dependent zinc metalloprotease FtsH [candidate division TM6 bacterium GW2011_GWF2_32_72]